MGALIEKFRHLPLSQQLALTAASLTLLATLSLVALAVRSSAYTERTLQSEYGQSVAQQLARRLSSELAANDLLGVTAELQTLVTQTRISNAAALDVDGMVLSEAGKNDDGLAFTAPIEIAGDFAGTVRVSVDTREQTAARQQFMWVLSGLSLVLSFLVYGVTRPMGHRIARNIEALSLELAEVNEEIPYSANELKYLRHQIQALPLDLLKAENNGESKDEHYDDTAILYIHLSSLATYVEALDQPRLQRYIKTLHRLIYGACGFYDGKLNVARQFGITVVFTGSHNAGSPVARAAACAWLIRKVMATAENALRLKLNFGLAVGISELGMGDSEDIYPGLYTQSTIDELLGAATTAEQDILVTKPASRDVDFTTRCKTATREGSEMICLQGLSDRQRDLVERQAALLMKAIAPEVAKADPTGSAA